MLTIILKILQVIGIILLSVLCLALLLLLLVLFVPVRYKVTASGDGSFRSASGQFSWLLHLVRGRFVYPEPGELELRVLFFRIGGKKSGEGAEDVSQPVEPASEKGSTEEEETVKPDGGTETVKPESHPEEDPEEPPEDVSHPVEPASEVGSTEKEEAVKPEDLFEKLERIGYKVRYTSRKTYVKIQLLLREKEFYLHLLEHGDTRGLIRHVKKRIGKMIKVLLPRKAKADLRFGMKSPDLTGYLYGLYALCAGRLGSGCRISPDFEEEVFEGTASVSGRIFLGALLGQTIPVLFDRRLWKTRKRLKKHKEASTRIREREDRELEELKEISA
ncbi:MAG: hypothetical protein IKS07_04900 [Lachnospiraceae bacterium]|nr:hypothetical protein [Lachnospiraceae bacterium]